MEQLEFKLECKNEDHIWSGWRQQGLLQYGYEAHRVCEICGQMQYLVPKPPSKLPVRRSFNTFLADFLK